MTSSKRIGFAIFGVALVLAVVFATVSFHWSQTRHPYHRSALGLSSSTTDATQIAQLEARLATSTKAHTKLQADYDALKRSASEASTAAQRSVSAQVPEIKSSASNIKTVVQAVVQPSIGNAPFTLAYALIGDSDGQIRELAASLKSVFKNLSPPAAAPPSTRSKARIFLVCDELSSPKVWEMLSTELVREPGKEVHSGTNVDIDIQTITLPANTLKDWEKRIRKAVEPFELAMRHTFGTYVRLFLHLLIPPPANSPPGSLDNFVIYADTDLVFLIDPQILFNERRAANAVQFGPSKCAGLILLNLARLPKLLADLAELIQWKKKKGQRYGYGIDDQMMLNAVEDKDPELVGKLSQAWDGHLINHGKKRGDALVTQEGFALGVLHFNGGGGNPGAYYEYGKGDWKFAGKQDWINKPGWKLAQYYSGLPWIWLRLHLQWASNPGRIRAYPMRVYNGSPLPQPDQAIDSSVSPTASSKPSIGSCGPLRKYPVERSYGLNKKTAELPDFLTSKTKYIRGVQPKTIAPPGGRAKACVVKPSPQEPTSTDGLNPSTVFFKDGHFLTLIGDSVNGDNQCIYPKPSQIGKGGSKRAMIVLQGPNFETISQVQIDLRSRALIINPNAKWGKQKLKDKINQPPAITDGRLRWFGEKLMISYYSGKDFGYEAQVFQPIHLDIDDAMKLSAAYIFGEETKTYCCGRNFAFFQVPGATPQGYFAEWALPPKFRPLESDKRLPDLPAVLYAAPNIKVHGTSPTLVHIDATDELLTITHVHRPPGRPGASSYALHGHHYTHFFVTYDRTTLKIKRISNEFCFAATDLKTEVADCDVIQFASGLDFQAKGQKLAISWGINDCEGAIGLFDWSMADKLLLPVGGDDQDETQVLAKLFS